MNETTEVARVKRTVTYDFRIDAIVWRRKAIEEYIKAHELPPMFIDQATDAMLQEFTTKYQEYLFRYAITEAHASWTDVASDRTPEETPTYLVFGYGRDTSMPIAHPIFGDDHLDGYLMQYSRHEDNCRNDGFDPTFVMEGYIAYQLTMQTPLTEDDLT